MLQDDAGLPCYTPLHFTEDIKHCIHLAQGGIEGQTTRPLWACICKLQTAQAGSNQAVVVHAIALKETRCAL